MVVSQRTKEILWMIVCVIIIGIAWLAYDVHRAWSKFASEDRICGEFHPVIFALSQYQESTGTLPTNLTQLIPTYITTIPTTPVADSIDYQVMADGTNWQLTVHTHITGAPRVFIQRSSHQFTDAEQQLSVTGFHGWLGFRE